MAVPVSDLVADIRIDSGLRQNQLFTDAQIAKFVTEAYAKLRDIFIGRFSHWFRASYRFTLTGGVGGNTLDLSLIPNLQMDQFLNRNPDALRPETVRRLGSVANRNDVGGWFGNGVLGTRRYDTDGDVLTVYPPATAAGSYELVYTPMRENLIVVGRMPAWDEDDSFTFDGTFQIIGAEFDENDVGGTLTVEGSGEPGYDGVYTITEIVSENECVTEPLAPGVFSFPDTTTFEIIPSNSRKTLPQPMTPWTEYIKVYSCIKIRRSRNQDISSFEIALREEKERALEAAKTRSEGSKQPPVTRRRRRFGGGSSYGG